MKNRNFNYGMALISWSMVYSHMHGAYLLAGLPAGYGHQIVNHSQNFRDHVTGYYYYYYY